MGAFPFRSLASSLVRRTLGVAILCALVAAGIQALLAVKDERAAFDRALADIAQTNVPLLSVSLWDIEPDAVRRQLKRIASQPEIAYLRLAERTGHVFEEGDPKLRGNTRANFLDIPYPQGRSGIIGTLEVFANQQVLYRHVLEKVLAVVAGYAALSAILCALIGAILRTELEKPMRDLARFTSELTPDHLTTPLHLARPERHWKDEIDLVSDAFRTLQDAIHSHVATLDGQVAVRTAQLQAAVEEIKALTLTDALTGCFNRRHLDERLIEEVLRSRRAGSPLAVIVADIDHFKRVNDTFGHGGGDVVLRSVADALRTEMRARIDWVARYGGEEFVIVLPDTALDAAIAIAERLRAAVESSLNALDGKVVRITASFGVAECASSDDAASLIARADAMLYQAKSKGRNRVVASSPAHAPEGDR